MKRFLSWFTAAAPPTLAEVLDAILIQGEDIMAAIDDLNVAVQALQAEGQVVVTAIGTLTQKVADLMAQLANQPNLDPQIAAAASAVQAEVSKLQAAVPAQ